MSDTQKQNSIPCSVGILTFNSGKSLSRCLESVKDFAEIIIADGGSTDDTLAIAKEYGAKIMQQSQQGKVIEDFALERNRLVEATSQNWFFYVDSDEIVTPELAADIHRVTGMQPPEHCFYDVRMQFSGEGGTKLYRMYKPLYQIRLFNKATGARFGKRIHEKVRFDHNRYSVGKLEGAWLVPLDGYLDFATFKRKTKRNARIVEDWRSKNPLHLFQKILPGFFSLIKLVIKCILLRLRHDTFAPPPVRFYLHMGYELLYLEWRYLRRYVRNILNLS